jgi:hypothetical protein
MRKALLGFLLGIALGIALGVYGVQALAPTVSVLGTVEYASPSPGATAVPPEGYYVNSMIYIDGLTKDSVGKTIVVRGRLGSIPDTDHFENYPKLFDIKSR